MTNKDREIPLTQQEYSALERAMQWPEDLAKYDRIAKPTNLMDLTFAQVAPPKDGKSA